MKIDKKNKSQKTGKTSDNFQIEFNINKENIELANQSFRLFTFEASGFSKIIPNFGFLTRIGLIFKKKHPFNEIYKATELFDNELNRYPKDEQKALLVLEAIDDNNIRIHRLRMKVKESCFTGKVTYLTIKPLKINDRSCIALDFITYIAEKVFKAKDTTDIPF